MPAAAAAPRGASKPFPFLELPLELRKTIYEFAINWPSLSQAFSKVEPVQSGPDFDDGQATKPPLCTFPKPHYNSTSTPALLLVNRRTSSEAQHVLYARYFVLSSPPPYIPQLAKPMDITEFVSETTLQKLRYVVLEMDLNCKPQTIDQSYAKCWLKTVETLLDVWCVKNELEQLVVRATYVPPERSTGWTFGATSHHRSVMGLLSRLRGFANQVPVVFEGQMPKERMVRRAPAPGQWYDVID